MNELIKDYIDFINELDPYWECYEDLKDVIEIEASDMLYNLLAIKEESEPWRNDDPELYETLLGLIQRFKAKGVEII